MSDAAKYIEFPLKIIQWMLYSVLKYLIWILLLAGIIFIIWLVFKVKEEWKKEKKAPEKNNQTKF